MKSKALFFAAIVSSFVAGVITASTVDLTGKYFRTTEVISYRGREGVNGIIPKGSVLVLESVARERRAYMRTGVILDARRLSEYAEPMLIVPNSYDQYRYMLGMYTDGYF